MNRMGALMTLLSLSASVAAAADLSVSIEGVRNGQGTVWVALFDGPSAFDVDRRYAGAFVAARAGQTSVAFPDLEPGAYVVSVFHDENADGQLDTDFIGIPTEGYGFSNNAMGFAGPPSFDDASFSVGAADQSITLKLRY